MRSLRFQKLVNYLIPKASCQKTSEDLIRDTLKIVSESLPLFRERKESKRPETYDNAFSDTSSVIFPMEFPLILTLKKIGIMLRIKNKKQEK